MASQWGVKGLKGGEIESDFMEICLYFDDF